MCAAAVALAAHASSSPESGLPAIRCTSPTCTIHAAVARGNLLYIGGEFTVTNSNGNECRNLAAIELDTLKVSNVACQTVDGPVYALALSSQSILLFLGGSFTDVSGSARHNLAAMTLGNTTLVAPNWRADTDGAVRALALSSDATVLYVGGDFRNITVTADQVVTTAQRSHLASLAGGAAATRVLPWDPNADDIVRSLALDDAKGLLYVGGDFTSIGGLPRRGLAALGVASLQATTWDPQVAGTRVDSLLLSGNTLYVGGSFSAVGGAPRNNLAAIDLTKNSGGATVWDPDVNGEVLSLALTADGLRLYAGGTFSSVKGASRAGVAAIRTDDSAGVLAWDPGADNAVNALAIGAAAADATEHLYAGGDFASIGGSNQAHLASFNITAPTTALDPPPGAHAAPLASVTLTCNDRSGATCARICYVTGPAAPDPNTDCIASATVGVPIGADTTFTYFSEDRDGNREPTLTAHYVTDSTPPITRIDPPQGLYGRDGLKPIILTCDDATAKEFGCKTYYTLDGTDPKLDGQGNPDPSTSTALYATPIDLSAFFPPPDVPSAEVTPDLLAGTVTLKVFSIDSVGNAEAVKAFRYEVDLAPPAVTASLPGGSYPAPQTLTLSCNDYQTGSGCAAMYYTTDNSPPTLDDNGKPTGSTKTYQQPLQLSSAATINVLAIDKAGNRSTRLIGIYAFNTPSATTRKGVGAADPMWMLAFAGGWLIRRRARTENRH
jgi:hypothetical protein